MRAAPAVTVELPGSRRWDALAPLLGAKSFAASAATLCGHLELGLVPAGVSIATAGLGGALLLWFVRPPGRGTIRWDGAQWWYRAPGAQAVEQAGQVQVMMDFHRWMLLRFDADAPGMRGAWLPVAEARLRLGPELRAAVYCRALNPQNPARRGREPE
ncbi:hypothetical protein [Ideonella sp. BN130291]|uniref:hypothetical protein n=1 Tax=Ideonella sp. BN130291 TaxID=3112940 RepID=UPI002E25CA9D|nr:hypothetical protein [Ideonella sp. BN130291]